MATGIPGFSLEVNVALPALWDGNTVLKQALASGRKVEELFNELQTALAAVSAGFLADPLYGRLLTVTEDPLLEYPSGTGGTKGPIALTDLDTPDPKQGRTAGHMLPRMDYGDAVGWSVRSIGRLREARIRADIQRAVDDASNHLRQKTLQRFFKMEGETVGSTSNASLPFADGTATSSGYIPPVGREGKTFATSHDHYTRIAATTNADVEAAIEHLAEHGHKPPYDIIIPNVSGDKTTWKALSGFVEKSNDGIKYSDDITRLMPSAGEMPFFGAFDSDNGFCAVWVSDRVPTAYWGAFKSYGVNHPRNPLAMLIDPLNGFGWQVVPGNWVNLPLALAAYFFPYGVGINDRTAGYLVEVDAAGDYGTPTIS